MSVWLTALHRQAKLMWLDLATILPHVQHGLQTCHQSLGLPTCRPGTLAIWGVLRSTHSQSQCCVTSAIDDICRNGYSSARI